MNYSFSSLTSSKVSEEMQPAGVFSLWGATAKRREPHGVMAIVSSSGLSHNQSC